jgi:hypothetical protein
MHANNMPWLWHGHGAIERLKMLVVSLPILLVAGTFGRQLVTRLGTPSGCSIKTPQAHPEVTTWAIPPSHTSGEPHTTTPCSLVVANIERFMTSWCMHIMCLRSNLAAAPNMTLRLPTTHYGCCVIALAGRQSWAMLCTRRCPNGASELTTEPDDVLVMTHTTHCDLGMHVGDMHKHVH